MKIHVDYSKPHNYDLKMIPNAEWQYSIRESDESVSGFAGGLLSRTPDGLWIAHYWNHATGEPAKTREQAILNLLPRAAAIVLELRTQQAEHEQTYDARMVFAQELAAKFPKKVNRTVAVHDTTAQSNKPSPEARFKVTITYPNLTADEVEFLAKRGFNFSA